MERALDDNPGCLAAAIEADRFEEELEELHEAELRRQLAIPKRHAESMLGLLGEKGFKVEGN